MSCNEHARLHSHAENRHKPWYYGKQECRRITDVFRCNYLWYKTNIFLLFLLQVSSANLGSWYPYAAGKMPSPNLADKSHGVTWAEMFLTPPISNSARFQVLSTEAVQTELLERRGRSPWRASFVPFTNITSYFAISHWGRLHIYRNSIG
jgi:hypothetical protein